MIPYVTDQLAMAELSRATYSLMVSLLPAIATLSAWSSSRSCQASASWSVWGW